MMINVFFLELLVLRIIFLFLEILNLVCSEASSLLDNLYNFKIILTVHILFLNIFKIIGPTSRYLQTRVMDLLSAWSMMILLNKKLDI